MIDDDPMEAEFGGMFSSDVDLQRIVDEIGLRRSADGLQDSDPEPYLEQLKYKSPAVYARLREFCLQTNQLTWWGVVT